MRCPWSSAFFEVLIDGLSPRRQYRSPHSVLGLAVVVPHQNFGLHRLHRLHWIGNFYCKVYLYLHLIIVCIPLVPFLYSHTLPLPRKHQHAATPHQRTSAAAAATASSTKATKETPSSVAMIQHHVDSKKKEVQAHIPSNLATIPATSATAPFIGIDWRQYRRPRCPLLSNTTASLGRRGDNDSGPRLGWETCSECTTMGHLRTSRTRLLNVIQRGIYPTTATIDAHFLLTGFDRIPR